MTRVNKKTRIKGLPAKLQSQENTIASGSYPTIFRTASDNRKGNSPLRFDDTTSANFIQTTVHYPSLIPVGSPEITSELTSSLTASGYVRKGIRDQFIQFTTSGAQNLRPFFDINHPAVEGKSAGSTFYATGSSIYDVGDGFSSPLWSKTKFEINFSIPSTKDGGSTFRSYYSSSGTEGFVSGTHFAMAYYNFDTNTWDGIGVGRPIRGGGTDSRREFGYQGFSPGLVCLPGVVGAGLLDGNPSLMFQMFEWQSGAGRVIDKFGFPFDGKYHATSSQVFSLNGVISQPFLVEKIVIEFSGALTFDPNIQNGAPGVLDLDLTGAFVPASVSNFFILNQRKFFSVDYQNRDYVLDFTDSIINFTHTLPTSSQLTQGAGKTRINTVRDIVTYAGITSFASNMPNTLLTRSADTLFTDTIDLARNPRVLMTRDINIDTGIPLSNSLSALNWSGRYKIEVPARAPNKIIQDFTIDTEAFDNYTLRNTKGGRNGLGVIRPSGRDLRSPITTPNHQTPTDLLGNNYVLVDTGYTTNNPYLLFPEDNLIIGFQQPLPTSLGDWGDITTGTGSLGNAGGGTGTLSTMTFIGPAKLTFYGSHISNGTEIHQTLNQNLTSDAIHEVIG